MRALVVYESLFGNTAEVGEAIAASLEAQGLTVDEGLVSEIAPEATGEADLLVVGGPTHVHGMTRASTRKTAATDVKNTFPTPTVEPGLREWLQQIPSGSGRLAAAFDTRVDKPVLFTGSAAKGIGHRLEKRDFRLVVEPECFFVSSENDLLDGELERAGEWAAKVGDRASAGVPSR
jgi:hypothetical protein